MALNSKTLFLSVSSLALVGAGMIAADAQAAGFYIQEQSVSGLGSAFSGSVTNLNDASTIYFNPAGMTKLPGTQIQAAAHLLIPNADLTDAGSTTPFATGALPIDGGNGGNPYDPTPVPNGFVSHQVNDKLWVGVGVTAPFGLANEYDADWFGRYDSIKTNLTTIDIQPSMAYKWSDKISLGFGVNIQHAQAELTNAANAGGTEGVSTLEGDDWTYGYTLGIQAKPYEHTTLGLSYRSKINHTAEGSLSTRGTGNADFYVKGRADLNLPEIVTFGAAHDLNDKLTLQGQATWFGWGSFKDITTVTDQDFTVLGGAITRNEGDIVSSTVQNYSNTLAYAVGAEYDYNDSLTLRTGVQYDQTPTNDAFRTSRTPDGDRTWLSAGGTYDISNDFSLDFAATYIWISDETIDVTRNNSFSNNVRTSVKANTGGNVGIFALGVNYKF